MKEVPEACKWVNFESRLSFRGRRDQLCLCIYICFFCMCFFLHLSLCVCVWDMCLERERGCGNRWEQPTGGWVSALATGVPYPRTHHYAFVCGTDDDAEYDGSDDYCVSQMINMKIYKGNVIKTRDETQQKILDSGRVKSEDLRSKLKWRKTFAAIVSSNVQMFFWLKWIRVGESSQVCVFSLTSSIPSHISCRKWWRWLMLRWWWGWTRRWDLLKFLT